MKKITLALLIVISFGQVSGQADKQGNPVFNSVSTNEKSIDDFLLIQNYYTLRNNIENKNSSVFVSERPTLHEIENAAIDLPLDFFILTKESKMVVMVLLQNEPRREFMAIVMATKKRSTFPCTLIGDITENRANEIVTEKYDSTASINSGKLKFNGKELKIITNQEIEDAVLTLIKKEKLDKEKPSEITLPSKKELKTYILAESKEGGQLDFFTEIKGKEFDGVQVKPGVFSTRQSVALYKWGRTCFELGVNTVDDAYEIYSESRKKVISQRDKEYIRMGFFKEWEK